MFTFKNKNSIFGGQTIRIIFHGLVEATRDKHNVILIFLTSLLLSFTASYSVDFSWVTVEMWEQKACYDPLELS